MEIVVELLFMLVGGIVRIVLEILAQAVFELLAEIGMRSLAEPFKPSKPPNPFFAVLGYVMLGAIAGGLSLLLPKLLDAPLWLRILNLIVTPIACGLIMAKLGQIRARREQRIMKLDTFLYGYLFALSMAIVRFVWR